MWKYPPYFDSTKGVKQGEPLSILLFLIFIKNFVIYFFIDECYTDTNNSMFILIPHFAEDIVLLAKTPGQLQCSVDQLQVYCET